MKATVISDNLRIGISFAHHGVSGRAQLPILLNFLLQAKDGNLYVSSTDLEIGIRAKIPAKVEEEGETTVPAKTFMDLISNINQEKLELSTKDNVLELKGPGLKTTFPTLQASEFPRLYEAKGDKGADFKKEEFDRQISRVVFAAAGGLGRPALSGVLLKKEAKGGLVMVATDGYRLSLGSGLSTGGSGKEEEKLLIPARVIKELVSQKAGEGDVSLFVSDKNNQVVFDYSGIEIVGRLIEAEYPDYQKIIPQESTTSATFNRADAQNAVRACSVFAREAANIVKMSILKDKIMFSASASSVGENEVEIEAKTTGEENEIAFNARYLLELFSNIDEEQMVFEMTGPLNPGVFKLEKDKNFLHLIMPIRIQE